MAKKQGSDSPSRFIELIGVPTDIGAGSRGGSMGPEALRVAGIEGALRRLGYQVKDGGNLEGPSNPQAQRRDGFRHLEQTAVWSELIRDRVISSLDDSAIPIIMGGDHSITMGSVAGISQWCRKNEKKLFVLWLDAHADFNTSRTSPSGNIHGMPAAVICGEGHQRLLSISDKTPMLKPSRLIQIGIRSVDIHEKEILTKAGVTVFDMRMIDEQRIRTVMEKALKQIDREGAHLHLSFDVDFLDPTIAPGVATTVSGGPNYREAQLCMEMISDSGLIRSLDVVELNPAFDDGNRTAELAVELIESAFGKQILARHES